MEHSTDMKKFRKGLTASLEKLAKHGCGDGGWCECLLCRVMRIVQTEQFRNKPDYSDEWAGPKQRPSTTKTVMKNWRGGQIEFAKGSRFESIAFAPWYAIKFIRQGQDEKDGWVYWLDYAGPPQLFLTRKAATAKAKELRKQYCCKSHYEGSYRKVKVIKIGEI